MCPVQLLRDSEKKKNQLVTLTIIYLSANCNAADLSEKFQHCGIYEGREKKEEDARLLGSWKRRRRR